MLREFQKQIEDLRKQLGGEDAGGDDGEDGSSEEDVEEVGEDGQVRANNGTNTCVN